MELLGIILHSFANLAILLLEYICAGTLIFAGIQGILNYMRREPGTRLILGKGISMALEFLLGSAVLRVLVYQNMETAIVALSIFVMFALLSILVYFGEKTCVPAEAEEDTETKDSNCEE